MRGTVANHPASKSVNARRTLQPRVVAQGCGADLHQVDERLEGDVHIFTVQLMCSEERVRELVVQSCGDRGLFSTLR